MLIEIGRTIIITITSYTATTTKAARTVETTIAV